MPIPGVTSAVVAALLYPRVTLADATIVDATFSPTNANATYSLTNTGAINSTTVSGGSVSLGNWVFPTSAAGANYEVRVTVLSGSLTSGTSGSWQALSTTRTWTRNRTASGSSTCVFTVEIRSTSTLALLGFATVSLSAQKDV